MNLLDDATLLKMAEAEILGEAKRAADRHAVAGVSGWQPCPKPNKVFLTNTLLQTLASNKILSRKLEDKQGHKPKLKKRDRKLLQKNLKNEVTNFVFQKPKKNEQKSVLDQTKKVASVKYKLISKIKKPTEKKKIKIDEKLKKIKLNKT